jgi:hypothetical protein
MKYLVAIHHPDDYDPFLKEDKEMHQAIDDINDEMVAAGIRIFVGGLQHISNAHSVTTNADGTVLIKKKPYLPTTEHVAGFWVLECATEEEALEWGRKATVACKAPVEVRPFH